MVMFFAGLISSPVLADAIRKKILSLKEEEFILASQSLGLSKACILFKHILWYTLRGTILTQIVYRFGEAILIEATLSYLGREFAIGDPSLGSMIKSGSNWLFFGCYWIALFPSLAIMIAIIGFNLLGDTLNEKYNAGRRVW